jgi:two-component system, OmpR family, response regulator ChvI
MDIGVTAAAPAVSAAISTVPEVCDSPILVVDDDELVLKTLTANLDDAGFRTVGFANGPALLRYLGTAGPAGAILLDWSMPGMDGAEVLRRLRGLGHQVPVIFLTGHAHPLFEETALTGGAVDFVDKSRSFAIVLQRLRLALAGSKRPTTAATPAEPERGLRIDDACARVYWRGKRVDLTLNEVKVVRLLAGNAGRDCSYRAIYDLLRGEGFQAGAGPDGFRGNVRAIIKRVRQSFRSVDATFDEIVNYPGFGYRWSANSR